MGDWLQAAALLARAKPILIGRGGSPTASERDDLMKAKLKEYTQPLRRHAIVLHHAGAKSAAARAEGFELAQWALQTDAAEALAQMSARLAKGEGPLVDLVRERQDLVARRQGEDKRLLAAVGRADAPTVAALRTSIADLDKSLEHIDAQLAGKFPEYAELSGSRPLATAHVQALLNGDEALVLFLDVNQLGPLPEETLAWIVTRQTVTWHRIPLGPRALADTVMALRCGLDESLWNDADSASKCVEMVKTRGYDAEIDGRFLRILPFDLQRAHQLYKALLGPVQDIIKGKHLLVVPSGALTSLPFNVLVTEAPKAAMPAEFADYRQAAWLGIRQPISVLPSVASLAALRRHAKSSAAPDPFLGYGDPALGGHPACGQIVVPDKCPDEEISDCRSHARRRPQHERPVGHRKLLP